MARSTSTVSAAVRGSTKTTSSTAMLRPYTVPKATPLAWGPAPSPTSTATRSAAPGKVSRSACWLNRRPDVTVTATTGTTSTKSSPPAQPAPPSTPSSAGTALASSLSPSSTPFTLKPMSLSAPRTRSAARACTASSSNVATLPGDRPSVSRQANRRAIRIFATSAAEAAGRLGLATQRPLHPPLGLALRDCLALVITLLAAAERDLQLRHSILEKEAQRNDRRPGRLHVAFEFAYLCAMQEQAARAGRVVVRGASRRVMCDVRAHKPHLSVLRADVCFTDADAPVADGLDFCPQEGDARVQRAHDMVIVSGFAVDCYRLFAHGGIREGRALHKGHGCRACAPFSRKSMAAKSWGSRSAWTSSGVSATGTSGSRPIPSIKSPLGVRQRAMVT